MRLFPVLLLPLLLLCPPLAVAQDDEVLTVELDTFAMRLLDQLQARSITDNLEYCGLIAIDGEGRLVATPPERGAAESCEPALEPADYEVVASYHTHGAYDSDADSEVPSTDDLLADIEEGIDGYIATPGGRVWLDLAEDEAAYLLCGPGCIESDPDFVECPALPPGEAHTLESLERREAEDTGDC